MEIENENWNWYRWYNVFNSKINSRIDLMALKKYINGENGSNSKFYKWKYFFYFLWKIDEKIKDIMLKK